MVKAKKTKKVLKLKKEFVSTVSHELRTPLTSIRGSLTLLSVGAMGALPDQAKKVVSIAERNTIRLIGLINDILDIEKLEAGKLDMVFENTGMKDILERSEQSVNTFAANNGVKLEMLPSDAEVYADGDRIVQVLVNLLSNAIKFSPANKQVEINIQNHNGSTRLEVIDQGPGLTGDDHKRLFGKYQRLFAYV